MAPSDEDFTERRSDYEARRPSRSPRRDRDDDDEDDRPRRRRRYEYDGPAETSGMAILSFVLALLSFFTCALTGLPALILGILALSRIKGSGGQLGGVGLAWVGIVLSGITLAAAPVGIFYTTMKTREAKARMDSSNNLMQIGLAMHNYHDVNNGLPPAYIATKDGKPGLSWRVAILPYIEQETLYKQFHLDEPWDSPHNMTLLAKMPNTYRSPNDAPGTTDTPYRVFVGKDALFSKQPRSLTGVWNGPFVEEPDPNRRTPRIETIVDGSSNTIMVVEAATKVPWTKPDELDFSMTGPLPDVGYLEKDRFLVLMCDGSVRMLDKKRAEKDLRNAVNPREGIPLGPDW